MEHLVSTIQGMEKNIKDILVNQGSLARIVQENIFTLNNKVDELTMTATELKKEVDVVPRPHSADDDDSPPLRTNTQFKSEARTPTVPALELRPSSSAPATPTASSVPPPPPISTPPPHRTLAEEFLDALLLTPSTTIGVASSAGSRASSSVKGKDPNRSLKPVPHFLPRATAADRRPPSVVAARRVPKMDGEEENPGPFRRTSSRTRRMASRMASALSSSDNRAQAALARLDALESDNAGAEVVDLNDDEYGSTDEEDHVLMQKKQSKNMKRKTRQGKALEKRAVRSFMDVLQEANLEALPPHVPTYLRAAVWNTVLLMPLPSHTQRHPLPEVCGLTHLQVWCLELCFNAVVACRLVAPNDLCFYPKEMLIVQLAK
ncbi:SWR1 complex subunit 6 [Hordeum vulgare]|nr:SWR1 complex subunit 6 [Hordeum vulgare]